MCASLNAPLSDEPRWPLVPKLTFCAGSSTFGRRSKYACSSAAVSARRLFGAGFPASGEMVTICRCAKSRSSRPGLVVPQLECRFGAVVIVGEHAHAAGAEQQQ